MRNIGVLMLAVCMMACGDNADDTLFVQLTGEQTGIKFNNKITENDSVNILEYEYVYNGGGVGIGDFNNDGLEDIYFTGNMVANRLYLNSGEFQFNDVTEEAGVAADGFWCSGVAVVDVNQDGWQDIYVCANTNWSEELRANRLYINTTGATGTISFEEQAAEYGLDDRGFSVNSAFFDYDNDGDLDVIIVNNEMKDQKNPSTYQFTRDNPYPGRVDKLYRNDPVDGVPRYSDVSKEAGIRFAGYSLGVNVVDINFDGWKDIYITNDFISEDLVYVNNGDGTFTDKASDYLKHTCHSAMGNDVADVNNDGMMDILALDMLPEDNYRKKTMMGPSNYNTYYYNRRFGYVHQYVRNVLHLNQGPNPVNGDLVFSEVAMSAGVEATDWSWAPMIADFDGDGFRDIIITNGFPKDVTDRDFIDYHANNFAFVQQKKLLDRIPAVKIPNYAFRNTGGSRFDKVTKEWGLDIESFSNGAAYADLDNDGDLDFIVNNIDDEAFVYTNTSTDRNYLKLNIVGPEGNTDGLGTVIRYSSENVEGVYEHSPFRGYLSSVTSTAHLGFGKDSLADLEVVWYDGKVQRIRNQSLNQTVTLEYRNADVDNAPMIPASRLMSPSTDIPNTLMEDPDFIDFNFEPLLFRKYSQYGPGIAVGDFNGDLLDDYYVPGAAGQAGKLFMQTAQGSFIAQQDLSADAKTEEVSALFFDADGDGDQDLYVCHGSNQFKIDDDKYRDVLYRNDNGRFVPIEIDIPATSSSCVRAADFDRDGDLDLFVGTRMIPRDCPQPTTSYVLINQSTQGNISFEQADMPAMQNIGMVSDALWTDIDNDGWVDLLIAGEWMPITAVMNKRGVLENASELNGLAETNGWWNAITSGDYDNDGDIDYVVSNYGTNSTVRASKETPVRVYVGDFDENGSVDAIPSVYLPDTLDQPVEVAFHGRGDLFKEIIRVKATFERHHDLGIATIDQVLTEDERSGADVYQATNFRTSLVENLGDGTFELRELPEEVQWAPVYGMLSQDVNADGNLDIIMVGNDFGVEIRTGRMDAFNGLVLLGDGQGEFDPQRPDDSGFYVPGDAKGLALLKTTSDFKIIAGQNNDMVLGFDLSITDELLTVGKDDVRVELLAPDGNLLRVFELYHGSGYLSQSSRTIIPTSNASIARITRYDGGQRDVSLGSNVQ